LYNLFALTFEKYKFFILDPDIVVNEGCILYKEGKYEEAREKFHSAYN
jgi:hypothetical protein